MYLKALYEFSASLVDCLPHVCHTKTIAKPAGLGPHTQVVARRAGVFPMESNTKAMASGPEWGRAPQCP